MFKNNSDVVVPVPTYDFNFIARSLGLLCLGENEAISPAAITSVYTTENNFVFSLLDGEEYTLTPEQMSMLENSIRQQQAEAEVAQKEIVKKQIAIQAEAVAELNRSVAPGMIFPPVKKF